MAARRGGATAGDVRRFCSTGRGRQGADARVALPPALSRDAAGAFIAVLAGFGGEPDRAAALRLAMDTGITRHDAQAIAARSRRLVGVAILRGIFTFLQGFLAERASQGFAYDMRNALFTQIEQLSFSYYDTVEAGQLLTRVTSDVEQIRCFAGNGIVQMAAAVVMLVGSAVLLLFLNWRLALVSLTIIPAIVFLITRFIGKIRPLFGQVQQTLEPPERGACRKTSRGCASCARSCVKITRLPGTRQ